MKIYDTPYKYTYGRTKGWSLGVMEMSTTIEKANLNDNGREPQEGVPETNEDVKDVFVSLLPNKENKMIDKQEVTGSNKGHGWEVDWCAAKKEFIWINLWKERSWGNKGGHLIKALLIGLIPSFFDIGTDSLGVKNFIMGAKYTKSVPMFPDPNDMMNLNCTHIAHFSQTDVASLPPTN